MTDWRDMPKGELFFEMLPPANLDDSYGQLDGVILSGCSITEGYYTDARVSAKLEVEEGNWIRQSAIRITYRVPEMGYEEELGTFFATGDSGGRSKGLSTVELDLVSTLHAMSLQKARSPHWLQPGAYARTAMRQMCDACHREMVDDGANDHVYSETSMLESGESYLDRMFALCEDANDRLDVDGHGRVLVQAYVLPSQRVPTFEIDLDDPRGIAHDGVDKSSDYLSLPSEVHVIYRWTEGSGDSAQQMEIAGSAYGSGHVSFGSRGYIVSEVEVLNELEPAAEWRAEQIAQERLAALSVETEEWTLTTEYLPIHRGDVGYLRGDGPERLVMVKSLDLNLENMQMKLTLKSAESADRGDE